MIYVYIHSEQYPLNTFSRVLPIGLGVGLGLGLGLGVLHIHILKSTPYRVGTQARILKSTPYSGFQRYICLDVNFFRVFPVLSLRGSSGTTPRRRLRPGGAECVLYRICSL